MTTIFTQIGRYEREADLYTFHSRVRSSIQNLFAGIITILVVARAHQNRSKFGRVLAAALSDPFDEPLKTLAKSVDALDRELRTAAQEGLTIRRVEEQGMTYGGQIKRMRTQNRAGTAAVRLPSSIGMLL